MAVLKANVGGAWVPVGGGSGGGGSDEVFVGPSDPIATAPTTELWYDTDEPAVLTDDTRWNTAWGVVASASNQGTVTTSGTTELRLVWSSAFDAVAGRRYKITAEFTGYTTVVGDLWRFVIRRGITSAGTAVKVGPQYHQAAANAGYNMPFTVICQYDTPGAVAGLQYNCAVARMGGTGTFTMVDTATNGVQNTIVVEDVGPATGAVPALPPLGGCRIRRVATQLLTTGGSSQDFIFDTEDADTHGYFAPSSTTVTIPAGMGGLYLIGGEIGAAANTGATCYTDLKINNVVLQRVPAVANASPPFPSFFYNLAAGDTIKIAVLHTAGVSVNFAAKLNVARIGVL